jgi:hypothetical protein
MLRHTQAGGSGGSDLSDTIVLPEGWEMLDAGVKHAMMLIENLHGK